MFFVPSLGQNETAIGGPMTIRMQFGGSDRASMAENAQATKASLTSQRIAILAPSIRSVMQLRRSVISDLLDAGHKVLVMVPDLDAESQARLDAQGVVHAVFQPFQSRIKAYAEFKNVKQIADTLKDFGPNVVWCYGGETMVRGALAAHKAKVPRIVSMVNGLPAHRLVGERIAGEPTAGAYTKAFRVSHNVVFQNHDDVRHLETLGILPPDVPRAVIPGTGVNLQEHSVLDLPSLADGLVFLMITRLEARKGVLEYCQAARELKSVAPNAKFLLAGPAGQADDGVGPELWQSADSNVMYLGPLNDIRDEMANCHVFVYPSHAEGMPPLVLEALSAGRPIITSGVAGCRETVDERVNGVLVSPGDATSLRLAIESFLKRPDLIPSMARASRAKAERRFDQTTANAQFLAALYGDV